MNMIDPNPTHVDQGSNVRIARQKLRLETCHLAAGCSLSFNGFAANNPTHGGITSETLGVVHIFITAKASKYRLTEQLRHAVPSVLAGAVVAENIPGGTSQAKGIIKLSIGEQTGVRSDLGTVKFQL